jgi:hypothetical protein
VHQEDAFDPLAAGRLSFDPLAAGRLSFDSLVAGRLSFCFFMIVVVGSVGFFFFCLLTRL